MGRLLNLLEGGGADFRAIPGLAVYFDPTDKSTLTFNSTTISGTRNKGNLGVGNFAQATAGRQPLYLANSINGQPGLQGKHDGTNGSYLAIAALNLAYTKFTHFTVFKRRVDTGTAERISGKYDTAANDREHMLQITTGDALNGFIDADGAAGGTSLVAPATPTIAVGTPYIAMHKYDGATNYLALNRTNVGTNAYSGGVFNGSGEYQLFNSSTFGENFAGDITADLFWIDALNAAQEAAVWAALSAQFGISIA